MFIAWLVYHSRSQQIDGLLSFFSSKYRNSSSTRVLRTSSKLIFDYNEYRESDDWIIRLVTKYKIVKDWAGKVKNEWTWKICRQYSLRNHFLMLTACKLRLTLSLPDHLVESPLVDWTWKRKFPLLEYGVNVFTLFDREGKFYEHLHRRKHLLNHKMGWETKQIWTWVGLRDVF